MVLTDKLEAAGVRISRTAAGAGWTMPSSSGCGAALKCEGVYLKAYANGLEARIGIGQWFRSL